MFFEVENPFRNPAWHNLSNHIFPHHGKVWSIIAMNGLSKQHKSVIERQFLYEF